MLAGYTAPGVITFHANGASQRLTGRKIVGQALFGAKVGVTLLSVFRLLALTRRAVCCA